MLTVRDVIGLALPAGTEPVAGLGGLDREVTWATRLRPTPPAFAHIAGGELVLLTAQVLPLLDERLTLAEAVRQLAIFGVAAVAHGGPTDAEARTAADESDIPLLELPADADTGLLERQAARVITERRQALQRRGQEVGRRLMELAIGGEPLATIVSDLAEQAGKSVALESRDGRLLAYEQVAGAPSASIAEPLLTGAQSALNTWFRSAVAASPAEPPVTVMSLNDQWARVVAPVIGREGLLGALSLLVPVGRQSPEDALLISRGAAACSVVLAREQAAASARREVELNLLDEVLDGALRSERSLLGQARRLGHDLEAPHVVFVARLDVHGSVPALSRGRDDRWSALSEVVKRLRGREWRGNPLWRVRNNTAEVIWPLASGAEVPKLAESLRQELRVSGFAGRMAPGEDLSLAYGRLAPGLEGIRRSHQEARQALMLGRRLYGPGHLTAFEDLGLYRLIFAAEAVPELRAFHDDVLGNLLIHDRDHHGDLVRTLDAFFAANGSPKEASSRLGVHRNTVLYRLERIAEIANINLNDPDVRLRLQLALRIHLALYPGD